MYIQNYCDTTKQNKLIKYINLILFCFYEILAINPTSFHHSFATNFFRDVEKICIAIWKHPCSFQSFIA